MEKQKYTRGTIRIRITRRNKNQDYCTVRQKCPIANGGYQEVIYHVIKLDRAKEIAMIQRNEKGSETNMSDKTKDYYNVNDVMKITGNGKSWCYETIKKLRERFLNEYKSSIVPQGKIPIWYFEEQMKNKKGYAPETV